MLRKQVDIVREEYLNHRMHGNLCSCGERIDRNNLFATAEHVAVKTVLALEEYALMNPEKAEPEPVTGMVRVGHELVARSEIVGTQPTMGGNHEISLRTATGYKTAVVSKAAFGRFSEDMWGKK